MSDNCLLAGQDDDGSLSRAVASGRTCAGYGDQSDREWEKFRLVAGHQPPLSVRNAVDSSSSAPPTGRLDQSWGTGGAGKGLCDRNGIPTVGNRQRRDPTVPRHQSFAPRQSLIREDEPQRSQDGDDNGWQQRIEATKFEPGTLIVQRHYHRPQSPQLEEEVQRTFHVGSVGSLTLQELSAQQAGLGCSVWPSALVLAGYIAQHPAMFGDGKRVLELGSGIGLPAFVSASLPTPPEEVTHSDLSELLKSNAERNIKANKQTLVCKDVRTQVLQWDDFAYGHASARQSSPGYDVVLGADVVYNPANAVTMHRTALAKLRDGGLLCLCHPAPSELRRGYASLLEALHQTGTVHEVPVALLHLHDPQNDGHQPGDPPLECLRRFNIVLFWKNILALPPCE